MYAPLMEPAILAGYGPRVAESAIGLITNMAASAPYEELRLKSKREQAHEHLNTATTMYREMGMQFWLEQIDKEMGELR